MLIELQNEGLVRKGDLIGDTKERLSDVPDSFVHTLPHCTPCHRATSAAHVATAVLRGVLRWPTGRPRRRRRQRGVKCCQTGLESKHSKHAAVQGP